MKKISMFPHMGCGNHGCEAIIRSTNILLSDKSITIFSDHIFEDKLYTRNENYNFCSSTDEIQPYTVRHLSSLFKKYILKINDAFDKETYRPILNRCKKNDILLCSGGDLYCYDTPNYIYKVNSYVRKQGCKTVLWGCSVEPSYIDDQMATDLRQYDLICARESITYDALKIINQNTIQTVDPAFVLPMEEVELPADDYIGINISPLVQKSEKIQGITLDNYKRLISYILDNMECTVALIPHVVWEANDDRVALQALKDYFADNERVIMVDDYNALQLKYIIAHSRFFVGARTHATIAAYSSCVPTLVVGYSVKAKGIARDLFGREDDYVLPVQSLKSSEDLTNAFCWLQEKEYQIREHLNKIMPEYKKKTQVAVTAIEDIIS